MKLTPSQERAVMHRGSSLLVSASAGSGKTEVLSRRVLSLISDPQRPCSIDRLLVVTFTRAAAAELRVRIARMLRAEAAKTREGARRDHLRRQAVLVDAADIGTIDAWCGRLVRAHAAAAGVDPEFSVLSESDAHLLRQEVLEELMRWVYQSDEAPAREARAWLSRHAAPRDDFLRQWILGLNQFREHLVSPEGWLARERQRYSRPEVALRADAARTLHAALTQECDFQRRQLGGLLAALRPTRGSAATNGEPGPLSGGLQAYHDALGDWLGRLSQVPAGADADALLAVLSDMAAFRLPRLSGLTPGQQSLWEDIKERWWKRRLKDRWPPDEVETILRSAPRVADLTVTLLNLEQRYQSLLLEAKRGRNAYEFGDVLRMALDLLGTPNGPSGRTPTQLARRVREQYEDILIDEYQDTSPVQVELLRLVTRTEPGSSNRFMVGDVKQSIYAFRQAEPRLFVEQIRAFESRQEEGIVHYLSDNFRSHPALLTGLNRLFEMLFDPALGGTPFGAAEQLRAGRHELPNPTLPQQPRIALNILELRDEEAPSSAPDDELVPLERLEREAVVAAAAIRDLQQAGVRIPQRGADGQVHLRPLRLSDIVILLRAARQNAPTVANVLRDAGIPCVTGGRDALLEAPEIMDVRNVLSLLANRRQDVPLAAYLRSPMVGLSTAELLAVRAAAPAGDFCQAVEHFCANPHADQGRGDVPARVRAALDQLDRWAVAAREGELPELLRRILHDTGWPLFVLGLPGGEHRLARLRALENFARDFARQGQHGLADFEAYLTDLATAEVDPGVPVPAGEDAVRVMTIHAAKGLEFPVVLLLNAGARFNLRRGWETLQCDESLGVGLKFCDYPARAPLVAAEQRVISQRAVARDIEEELRLLYVATTRAREQLLIFGHAPAGAWDAARARFAVASGPPPLATRLSAANPLEWVMMGVAAGGLAAGGPDAAADGHPPLVRVTLHDVREITRPATPAVAADVSSAVQTVAADVSSAVQTVAADPRVGRAQEPVAPIALPEQPDADDETWLARAEALLRARVDTRWAKLPAVVSVSALKELVRSEADTDRPHAFDHGAPRLRPARFAEPPDRPDPTSVGTACHRFFEHADLTRLSSEADIRQQIDGLTAGGRLTADEARLIPAADVAWFGNTDVGRLLAEHAAAARRELPFVYACPIGEQDERTIVRGVIDCLLETETGLVLLDYKTDRIVDDAALSERVAGYAPQLQLYSHAAGQLFGRPVSRAVLVFLCARRLEDVACTRAGVARVVASLVGVLE